MYKFVQVHYIVNT